MTSKYVKPDYTHSNDADIRNVGEQDHTHTYKARDEIGSNRNTPDDGKAIVAQCVSLPKEKVGVEVHNTGYKQGKHRRIKSEYKRK